MSCINSAYVNMCMYFQLKSPKMCGKLKSTKALKTGYLSHNYTKCEESAMIGHILGDKNQLESAGDKSVQLSLGTFERKIKLFFFLKYIIKRW